MALTIVQAGMGGTGSTTASSTGTGSAVLATQPSFPSTIGVGGATAAASGAGITFPATQSASTDANTLDDYEEGTFTPLLISSGGGQSVTYFPVGTEYFGYYTKIGNMVFCQIAIAITGTSGGSGNLQVSGLPFTSAANPYYCAGSVGTAYQLAHANPYVQFGIRTVGTTNYANIFEFGVTNGFTSDGVVPFSALGNRNVFMTLSIAYRASS